MPTKMKSAHIHRIVKGAIIVWAAMLALWLVPTAQAQIVITGQLGTPTRVRASGPIVAAESYAVTLPSSASQETIELENSSASSVTITLTLNWQANELQGTGSLACLGGSTTSDFNLTRAPQSVFANLSIPAGTAFYATCPMPPTRTLSIKLSAPSGTGSLSIYVSSHVGSFAAEQSSSNPTAYNYTAITTSTNTQIKANSGTVHTITISQPGATANSITIVDTTAANCSGGTTVLTIPTAQLTAGMAPVTLTLDATFVNGICVTTAGTTSPQLAVSWR